MNLNTHEQSMLRSIVHSPKKRNYFTSNDVYSLAPEVARSYLANLNSLGLIFERNQHCCPTDKGRAIAEKLAGEATPLRQFCNATQTEIYLSKPWHVRAGAEDHKRHRTRGVGA